jgi:hypothetical protein
MASDVAVDVVAYVDESEADMWHSTIGWKGATWPNHELPHGTPGLANEGYVKSFLGPGGFEPRTSPPRYALTPCPPTIRPSHMTCYVFG